MSYSITVVAGTRTNVALAANGGVATASSTFSAGFPVGAVNNGERKGLTWGAGGGWNDATSGVYPDWVQITFNGQKSINEIDVFTLQDNFTAPVEPTTAMTFSQYGITAFDVQYWDGSAWVMVPGGSIKGNNLVWRTVSFPTVTTDRIRVVVNAALAGYSRITEIEAYNTGGVVTTPATISSVSPPSIVQGAVTSVTITGTNLTGATVGYSNGTVGTATSASATQIIVPITGTTVGAGTVTVTTAGGSSTGTLDVTAAVVSPPTISSISPPSIGQGVATSVTITGTNLTGATVGYSNGTVGTATSATATQIIVPITGTTVGTGTVTITTAGGSTTGTLTVTAVGTRTNVALAANGGVATASSTYSAGFTVAAVNNGDRKGLIWGAGGGWNDGTNNTYPDWVQITFNGQKSINEIDVFTLQDNFTAPVEPTPTQTFSQYGITAFDVHYWDGSAWVTVPGGSITGNNLVWRTVSFPAVTTDRIRVVVNAALAGYSRITEIEAYDDTGGVVTTPPTISSVSPSSIVQGVATSVTITGTNLTGATVGYSNGSVGTATSATATQIIVPITGTTVGTGTVTVATAGGSATGTLDVTAAPVVAPTISSMSPPSIVQGIATSVTITGTNLTGATVGYSNGTVGTATSATATQIIVPITGTTVGAGTVTVTTAGGSTTGALTVTAVGTRTNVALAVNGGVATASSSYSAGFPVAAVNNGDRKGLIWGAGGGWNDATNNVYPDWVQITFSGPQSISEIDVFTLQDNFTAPVEPTPTQTFSQYGITAFDVQYLDGSAWTTVPRGGVTGNSLVWSQFTFSAVSTDRIRILVNGALSGYSRITEVEAYTP
jgi:hypothetical protein